MIYTFPAGYGDGCYLVPIDKALIPLVAGALRIYEQERAWASREDYELGYNAIAELQICMTLMCMKQFIESQSRIYRLLDTALNKQLYYTDVVDGETVVLPPIPDIPTVPVVGMQDRLERIEQALDNGFNGTTYSPYYTDNRNYRQLLEDIKTMLEAANASDEDLLPTLEAIALLLA